MLQSLSILLISTLLCFIQCNSETLVRVGADILIEQRLELLQNKRIGLITNQTSRLSSGEFLVDTLVARGINVVALFGPEHGVRGIAAAGESVRDSIDERTGIPIISLYGKTKKPTPEMLKDVDVLVYDIQDVGVRFYTYISTMGLAMEASAERGIPFVVLDRPNPLGGVKVDGPVMEDSLKSFLGMYPIPIVYGLTCGELARMINDERWLSSGSVDLTVIPMEGWKRTMLWTDTGLKWIPPSPNIPTPATTLVYPVTCFIEATNMSEGRGTPRPFEVFGAPFVNGSLLVDSLNSLKIPGMLFAPTRFTPTSSKSAGRECAGVEVSITSTHELNPTLSGLLLLQKIMQSYPDSVVVNRSFLQRLLGSHSVTDMLMTKPSSHLESDWINATRGFRAFSQSYHLYPVE